MKSNTKNKVVVITGASSGIGEATAIRLAKGGARLVLGARREDRLRALKQKIEDSGGSAEYVVVDVTDVEQMKDLAQKALDVFGTIDVWMNNAGIMAPSLLSEAKIHEWDQMIDVNIKGTLYGIAAAQDVFHKNKSGHFINVSSVAGLVAHATGSVYSATKWAVRAINESLREEEALSGSNVRVTVLDPGAIKTDLPGSVSGEELKASIDDFYEKFAIPADRIAQLIENTINMPEDTTLNEIVIRPTAQVL